MAPLDQILALYRTTKSRRTFGEDLTAHLHTGVVLSTPEFLVLARPVPHHALTEQINNPSHAFPTEECDTWYIYAFAGRITAALRHFPYPLPYLAFERANQNGLRILPLEKFRQKCAALLPSEAPKSDINSTYSSFQ